MKRRALVSAIGALLTFTACRNSGTTDAEQQTAEQVVASGRFEAVTRPASGGVEVLKRGEEYTLKLSGVSVQSEGAIRVYLVGLDAALSTAAVVGAELKYDMGPLQVDAAEQRIELPGAPDPKLRSVVLWHAAFGANLAAARLR